MRQKTFKLFNDIIDDVTVTQYNERGGSIKDLTDDQQSKLAKYLKENNLDSSTPYMVNFEGEIFISKKRKLVNKYFKRLMLTPIMEELECVAMIGVRNMVWDLSIKKHMKMMKKNF